MLLAHSRALRAIENDLRERGAIPLGWYDVVLELSQAHDGLRMQTLGEQVVLSRTRVSRIVDELESRSLVARHADPRDGRATLVSVTKEGTAAFRGAAPIYLEGITKHFTSHLTPDEQRSVTEGLSRVVASAQDSVRPVVRPARSR